MKRMKQAGCMNKRFRLKYQFRTGICFLFLLPAFFSCNPESKKTSEKEASAKELAVPDFNADSAFIFVKNQVDFGPRIPNSESHGKCADFLAEKLRSYHARVTVQQGQLKGFDNKLLNFSNIIASYDTAN